MMTYIKKKFTAVMAAILLCTAAFGTTAVCAETAAEDTSGYIQVSTEEAIEAAVQISGSSILVAAGSYTFDSGLSIAEGVTLAGNGVVTFDFGTALMSGQAGLYISKNSVTIRNISLVNDSGAEKPVLKIQADDVTLDSCTISNYSDEASALVLHDSENAAITDCVISNMTASSSYNSYPVMQANAGTTVYIQGNSALNTATTYQAHIMFVYEDGGTYDDPSTLYFDESVSFGGASSYAVIYNEVSSTSTRADAVYIYLTGATEATELSTQEDTSTKSGAQTTGTDWYCYNAGAWKYLGLFSLHGYVYTNTSSGDSVVYQIAGSYLF